MSDELFFFLNLQRSTLYIRKIVTRQLRSITNKKQCMRWMLEELIYVIGGSRKRFSINNSSKMHLVSIFNRYRNKNSSLSIHCNTKNSITLFVLHLDFGTLFNEVLHQFWFRAFDCSHEWCSSVHCCCLQVRPIFKQDFNNIF